MSEHIFNWIVDTMARTETLDLYFIAADLLDIPESEFELYEGAFGDALAEQTVGEIKVHANQPLGKLVI